MNPQADGTSEGRCRRCSHPLDGCACDPPCLRCGGDWYSCTCWMLDPPQPELRGIDEQEGTGWPS